MCAGNGRAAALDAQEAGFAPGVRLGTIPALHTLRGVDNMFFDVHFVGQHGYRDHRGERGGLVYTCAAGFLDVDHLRQSADWVAYLHGRLGAAWARQDQTLKFTVPAGDRGMQVRVTLQRPALAQGSPPPWPELDTLARRMAFLMMTWHEVLTWFDYRSTFLAPEKISAFTYEDTLSHVVGIEIGARAVARAGVAYATAVDEELKALPERYGAQPIAVTRQTFARVRNRWWRGDSGWPHNEFITGRDLALGLDGSPLQPWTVPDLAACAGSAPRSFSSRELVFDAPADGAQHPPSEPSTSGAMPTLADPAEAAVSATANGAAPVPAPFVLQLRIDSTARELQPVLAQLFPEQAGAKAFQLNPRADLLKLMLEIERRVKAELGDDATSPDRLLRRP
ncbi:DUF4056 domain-containing protein [Ideonella azotifigens]|uniref:Uncharacterized protein n=1 Tax=Ideonella azotifigens TaxID=513160 RepID=A0ABN1KDQ8_9BURK|nr:DUF4056 domain-containing protein [Ideonella azotifigens]MCD2343742.1 DUF4056 domain-containing protein [Ideonella azotifigens]